MSYFISHLRVDGVLVIVTKHHRPGHVLQYDDRLGPSHTIASVEACAVGRIKESARKGPVGSLGIFAASRAAAVAPRRHGASTIGELSGVPSMRYGWNCWRTTFDGSHVWQADHDRHATPIAPMPSCASV